MTLRRRVKRVGGSLGVLIPRDFAEAMRVREGSEVRLTLVGNQVVVEPVEGNMDESAFRRAFAAVLRRHRRAFGLLAEYDRGGWEPPRRGAAAPSSSPPPRVSRWMVRSSVRLAVSHGGGAA